MAQAGLESWTFASHAGTHNRSANRPTGEQARKYTNKPYPVVKNMYYIMFVYSHLGTGGMEKQ